MLAPKRAKYRKSFRGSMGGVSIRGSTIDFGAVGLKAITCGWVTSRQIEAARRTLTHHTKRGGRLWIRIFPDKPNTKKPAETRMGSGKGDVFEYVAVVRPGKILFEMGGIDKVLAFEALKMAGAKLSVQTKVIERQ